MSFENHEQLLTNLGEKMISEADSDNWDQVARLHQELQDRLVDLFKSNVLPQDNRPTALLEHMQFISETIAARATSEREECRGQISRHQRRETARQSYSECFHA